MIPDNELSLKTVAGRFQYPDGIVLGKLTEDYEMGGVALQDPYQGLQVQPWYCYWDDTDNTVYVKPGIVGDPIPLFQETDVFELAFTFDQNMRWVVATFTLDGTFRMRWFDSSVGQYVVTTLMGLTSFRLCNDDKRYIPTQIGVSDVLLTYIENDNLYVRNQRDRFSVPHLLQPDLPKNLRITNFGMNERWRVQWRMRYRRPGELLPWLL